MRERTTRFVLLGVLHQLGTSSGYEAQRYIRESIGHFWSESFGQIYPELAAMADEGLVVAVDERPTGARARTRYRVTASGRAALRAWLAKPAAPQPVRQEALLKLFFGQIAGAGVTAAHLERELASHRERLQFFAGVAESLLRDHPEDPELAFGLCVLRAGQLVEAARVQWALEARELLAAHARGTRAVHATWRKFHARRAP